MAKQLSIGSIAVFDQSSKPEHRHLNTQLSRFSFTFRSDDPENHDNRISEKEFTRYISWMEKVSAERKQVQDSRFITSTEKDPSGHCDPDPDVFLESYPFIEEPVAFQFGDDYGDHLFLDLQKEVSYENEIAMTSQGEGMNPFVKDCLF